MKINVKYSVIKNFSLLNLLGLMLVFPSISSGMQYPMISNGVLPAYMNIKLSESPERSVKDYEYLSCLLEKEHNCDQSKSEPGFTLILDSIYEMSNLGYKMEYTHWYYSYDEWYRADTAIRYFYNELGEFQNIDETRSFYPDGNLKRLIRRQPHINPFPYPIPGDTGIIDYYIEEYTYTNGYLSWKLTISNEYSYSDSTNVYYIYDTNGKLIYDSTVYSNGSSIATRKYYYRPDGALEYIFRDGTWAYSVTKYTYEETDTARLTTEYGIYWELPVGNIIVDTITVWQDVTSFYETFNSEGRRASLTVSDWHRGLPQLSGKIFMAFYSYTEGGDIWHATYYHWEGSTEEGHWKEATRIDYTYAEEGNLLVYEKTFFDDRFESWQIENSKTYYYTSVPLDLPENITNRTQPVIFPNPAKDVITIKYEYGEYSYYTIYNLYGLLLESGQLENQEIDISQLKPGMYLVEIRNGNSISSGKFVKY
jgi:hypothetical protein